MIIDVWRISILGLLLALAGQVFAEEAASTLRVGMTPAFLHDQHALLADWRVYLERRLGRPVAFVQRDSYRETMDQIRKQQLDFAWLCDYPYVSLKTDVRLLATALYQGKPTYRSYLIVPDTDTRTHAITDLKDTVFAYADPLSNTGYVVPRHVLLQTGTDPDGFFRRTFFTWSHRKAIESVAARLAQGAAVDSYVWDSLQRVQPELVARTRIVWRSEEYGFPPFVAHRNVSEVDYRAFQQALFGMVDDPAGKALLDRLDLDGFIAGSPELYDGVERMMRALGER